MNGLNVEKMNLKYVLNARALTGMSLGKNETKTVSHPIP
jgi:hypothetical protein